MPVQPNTYLAETLLRLELPQKIMAVVAQAGGEARFVGGVVRDLLAGITSDDHADIDMAGTLPPEESARVLKAAGLRVIPTGIDHGTITVMEKAQDAPRRKVELTTLRRDIHTDGRHAEVVFGTDWTADAARRDFTINSLYADAEGQIFDPFGGVEDLKAGRVKFIHDAGMRIREDYLRMLRYFRFFGRFGRGDADAEALAAIRQQRAGLKQISGERIAAEIKGILLSRSAPAIDAMVLTGIDHEIAEGGFITENFTTLLASVADMPVIILFGYLIGKASPGDVADRLRLSNAERRLMEQAAGDMDIELLEGRDWQRGAWQIAKDTRLDMKTLSFLYAVWSVRKRGTADRSHQSRLRNWRLPVFPVTGGDLMDRGFREGEKLGQTLAMLEQQWIDGGFMQGKDELLNFLDA